MSFRGQPFLVPPLYSAQPMAEDPGVPLRNLSMVRTRMDSLQCFLTESINANALITQDQMDSVSAAITSAIRDVISNGVALLSYTQIPTPGPDPTRSPPATSAARVGAPEVKSEEEENDCGRNNDDGGGGEGEIVEVDAVELLAEHIHYCEICGKGFKRDANLRMHMRAHGNQFKTPEALAKPESKNPTTRNNTRFSCPYVGCNRNRMHGKFRALKSVVCVKNHFKLSHCPKMYSCNRCSKKSFSVVADLKSHLKHCGGQARWRCTCGTSFSRKTKLFGHMALFEGHMPAVEDDRSGGAAAAAEINNVAAALMDQDEEEEEEEEGGGTTELKGGESNSNVFGVMEFSDELLDGFGSIDGYFLQDMLVDL